MKETLRPGLSKVHRIVVDRDRTIGFMGEDRPRLWHPVLVRDIEHTCRDLLLEHGDAGEDSVGTEIAIKHLAPTLLGMSVEITATVSARGRSQGRFDVSAKDEFEPICTAGRMAALWLTSPRPLND